MNDDEAEDYFKSLLCVKCKKRYYCDMERKLCSKCLRAERQEGVKNSLDSIMKDKSKTGCDRTVELVEGLKENVEINSSLDEPDKES